MGKERLDNAAPGIFFKRYFVKILFLSYSCNESQTCR